MVSGAFFHLQEFENLNINISSVLNFKVSFFELLTYLEPYLKAFDELALTTMASFPEPPAPLLWTFRRAGSAEPLQTNAKAGQGGLAQDAASACTASR